MTSTALVLGGGGVTGIAWELGILKGLADEGVDLSTADLVVGTSAGSVVGAQVTSGQSLDELYAGQLEPADSEIGAELSRLTHAPAGAADADPREPADRSWPGSARWRCGRTHPAARSGSR